MANSKLWNEISCHWSCNVTRSLVPHRSGFKWTPIGVKQQAIVKYVKAQALAAPATDDDDTVADLCVDEVDRRWRTSDPNGMTIVHRIVRTVT